MSPIFTPPPFPHSTAWLGKGVPNLYTHPPPHHSTACVWPASWGARLGKGLPNLHPPSLFLIAPPVGGRYHGAPDLGKVSPIFTPPPPQPSHRLCVAGIMGCLAWERCPQSLPFPPPIAPPGMGKVSPIFSPPPPPPPQHRLCVAGIMGRLAWERCPQSLPSPPPIAPPGMGKVSPILAHPPPPPPVAPPVCGRYHGARPRPQREVATSRLSDKFHPGPGFNGVAWIKNTYNFLKIFISSLLFCHIRILRLIYH